MRLDLVKKLLEGVSRRIGALLVFLGVSLGVSAAAVNSATNIHSEMLTKHSRHIFGFPENGPGLQPKILDCSAENFEKISATHFISKAVMTLLNPGSRTAALVILEYGMIGSRRRDSPVFAAPSRATIHDLRAGEFRRVVIVDELDTEGIQPIGMYCRIAEVRLVGKAHRRGS